MVSEIAGILSGESAKLLARVAYPIVKVTKSSKKETIIHKFFVLNFSIRRFCCVFGTFILMQQSEYQYIYSA